MKAQNVVDVAFLVIVSYKPVKLSPCDLKMNVLLLVHITAVASKVAYCYRWSSNKTVKKPGLHINHHLHRWPGGQLASMFDSCLKDTVLNLTEASHCMTPVGKLFTPSVHSGAEGRLNQLTPGIAGTSKVAPGKSFTCVGSALLSLSSLIGG